MSKAILVVLSNPVSADREAEYNDWYDTIHLPDVLALPAFTGATRYRTAAGQTGPGGSELPQYCAVYEIDADDPQDAMKQLAAAAQDGRMRMSDVLSMSPPPAMMMFETVGSATPAV